MLFNGNYVEIDSSDYRKATKWVAKANNFVGEGRQPHVVDGGYVHLIQRGTERVIALYLDDDESPYRYYMHKSIVEAFRREFGYTL